MSEKQMTQKEAEEVLKGLVSTASIAMSEAEELAVEYDLKFGSIHDEYGMGGWFSSGEWHPSSQSC